MQSSINLLATAYLRHKATRKETNYLLRPATYAHDAPVDPADATGVRIDANQRGCRRCSKTAADGVDVIVHTAGFIGYAAHSRAAAHVEHEHAVRPRKPLYLAFNCRLPQLVPGHDVTKSLCGKGEVARTAGVCAAPGREREHPSRRT